MAITNGGPLRAPDTMVVFTPSTITIDVGETATVNYSSGTAAPSASTLDTLFGGIATAEVNGGGMVGTVVISGVSAGTASIAPSTPLGNGATMSQDGFTLTVTAPVEDDKFLNKRGLTHFWENIDEIKQDKLTAGAGISITGNTISATGGGAADSVAWGHITGSMSNQTDLTTALAAKANSADLATVATSGSYNDLSNKPTIPAKQVFYGTCDSSGGSSSKAVACSGFTYAEGNVIYVTFSNADTYSGDSGMIMNVNSTGAKVILTQTTSGGGVQSDYKWAAGETVCFVCHNDYYLMVEAAMATPTTSGLMSVNDKNKLDGIAAGAEVNVQANWTESDSSSDAYIQNKPTLATVATSGSYNDLLNKPTIPTVNNATLTIQKNGATVNTFTANASSNVTANITVPTKTSDLTNDGADNTSTYVEADELATVATTGDYSDLSGTPTIPTVNDATLTIKQNTTTLGTFTANASTGTTVTISTPTRTTIYSNSSGTNANFSTTSAMSNYDDVEITFRDANSNYATLTVPGSSGSFVLNIVHPGASSVAFWYISRFIVSGTGITVGANNMRKALQATSLATTAAQDIYITKMVGIKY